MTSERKVAVITGGSRGIGRAIALKAAHSGYDIAFCYRSNESDAEALQKELEAIPVRVASMPVDIANEADVDRFFNMVDECFGDLGLLVNNAGVTADGLLATMDIDDMVSVLNTNVLGTMLFCKHATKRMLPLRSGSIVNISSVSATKPNRGQCNYAASKGAVEAFTRALAVEVASKGIRVNCVAPGVIETDMAVDLLAKSGKKLAERLLAKRFAQPDDIARAVLFLADPDNHYITGEVLPVNGGLLLG